MKGYKICSTYKKVQGHLLSCLPCTEEHILGPSFALIDLEYKIGEWTEAKLNLYGLGYGLTFFQDLVTAQWGFPQTEGEFTSLYEVEAEDCFVPETKPLLYWSEVPKFWQSGKKPTSDDHYANNWPVGTMMCKRMKLLRMISCEEIQEATLVHN